MNYFAHGYRVADRPYLLAGTALPDWLGAADRRARLRRARIPDAAGKKGDLAQGIRLHHEDDAWFHSTEAFQRTWMELTPMIRPSVDGKAWFVAHVLLEMLLDRWLIEEMPEGLDAYYAAVDELDPAFIEAAIQPWVTRPPEGLVAYIEAFRRLRFLYGYRDDEGLCARLSRVAVRAGLPPLAGEFVRHLPGARRLVDARARDLLDRPA